MDDFVIKRARVYPQGDKTNSTGDAHPMQFVLFKSAARDKVCTSRTSVSVKVGLIKKQFRFDGRRRRACFVDRYQLGTADPS